MRWGTDVLYPIDNDEVLDDSVQAAGETAQDMAARKCERRGRWSTWTPSDPARRAARARKKKNGEGERGIRKNNKDFCDNVADQKKREKSNAKKDETRWKD